MRQSATGQQQLQAPVGEVPADPRATQPWPGARSIFTAPSGSYEGLARGDVDGDGRDDIVAGGYWFSYDGGNTYRANRIDPTPNARVAVGQEAIIQDSATGAGDWRGKVTRVSDWYSQRRSILLEPMQFNDVRTLECVIGGLVSKDPGQPPLRIGQRVRATLP